MQDCRIRRAKVVLTIIAMKLPSLRLLIIRLARYIILNTKLSKILFFFIIHKLHIINFFNNIKFF